METETLPSHRRPAPGELELVRALVNTRDGEDGTDELDSPERLRAWLAERRLLGRGARVTPAGVERVLRLREALRKLLLANNGEPLDRGAVRELNDLSERAPLAMRFAPDGSAALEAVSDDELQEHAAALARRMARLPLNQLQMLKLLCNQTAESMGMASSRTLGTLFDGIARHTQEGLDFVARSGEIGFRDAVRERDDPFGDYGSGPRSKRR